ncbi:hypothetical protein ACFLRZ_01900 [Bacteroidota bacterium]
MRKNFLFVVLVSLMIPFSITSCKKDSNEEEKKEIEEPNGNVDPKQFLWNKWWYNDTQTNVYLESNGTCRYFDDSYNGTWEWIDGSDTMKINGITTPVSWKIFYRNIEEHSLFVSFDFNNYTSSYTYTDQE